MIILNHLNHSLLSMNLNRLARNSFCFVIYSSQVNKRIRKKKFTGKTEVESWKLGLNEKLREPEEQAMQS